MTFGWTQEISPFSESVLNFCSSLKWATAYVWSLDVKLALIQMQGLPFWYKGARFRHEIKPLSNSFKNEIVEKSSKCKCNKIQNELCLLGHGCLAPIEAITMIIKV